MEAPFFNRRSRMGEGTHLPEAEVRASLEESFLF
jgi:hypothetical protein